MKGMVVVGLLGVGLGSFAQTPARADPVAFEQQEVLAAPFTVESIDRATRKVVVQSPDGARSTVNVAPSAPGLDTLKKGDQVELDYYRSSVLSLAPSGGASARVPLSANRTSTPAGQVGHAPSRPLSTPALVTFVDDDKGTVEITTPDGKPQTLFVQDPAIRRQLRAVHPGDRITVTYTEPVALGLRRAAAK